ncbi:glycosyltransferase family 39 protein [Streptomyces sp. NPDC051976]|uniref:ArnT family glycosyltransferase n=1 Tax=Streptomyces sp. NPDC051976 TaxID=3154947 RepID=UPI00341F53A2
MTAPSNSPSGSAYTAPTAPPPLTDVFGAPVHTVHTVRPAAADAPETETPRQAAPLPQRLWYGRPEDPRWARPAFLALLLGTLVLYLWNLDSAGYANSFYSAAVQAGSQSWKAFFFGSSDAANAITVDKPPAALWPMALSVRLFGLGSWQILVPEALMGVASVGVLYAAVRRRFSAGAGLLAGAVLALTPVAALMFRFNNPDALLALLMVTAVYCVLRAVEDARTKWLLLAGVAFGLAFLTKTLQAWLIVPPLAVVYAVCAPTTLRRRLLQLLAAGGAMVVSGGWWVTIVELWPKSSRPYIGGSQDNSFLSLTFGYNGFGRITGNETGSVGGGGRPGGGGGGGGGMWGQTGIGRLFSSDMGGQIAWLLPAAFALLAAGLWVTWRARRTDARRAAFLAWGGALLITFATFSFMSGIFHQYYNIALAPYIAALTGMGAALLWERRTHLAAAATLAVTVAGTGVWSYVLLNRSADWLPWLRTAVLIGGFVAAAGLLLGALPGVRVASRLGARAGVVAAVVGLAAALGGPVAYSLNTVDTGHSGSIVTAGPTVQGGGTGGRPGGGRGGFPQGQGGGTPRMFGGGAPTGGAPTGGAPTGGIPGGLPGGAPTGAGGRTGGGGGGGMGGLLNGTQVSAAMKSLLLADADKYTWVAAAVGSQNQASYQLATGKPVMSIGGFNGSDPSPTLAQFKQYVASGRIHYFLGGGQGGGMGGGGTAASITTWVQSTFTAQTVGSATVYDLTAPK